MKKALSVIYVLFLIVSVSSCSKDEIKYLKESNFLETKTTQNYVFDIFEDYVEIVECTSKDKEIQLPNEYEGKPVCSVGNYAFEGKKELEEIEVPSSIVAIGQYAFSSCKNLKRIKFSEGLEEISSSAFENDKSLESIQFPQSLKKIGALSFCDCEKLGQVKIPASVKNIGAGAFLYTKWLSENKNDFVFAGDGVLIAYNGTENTVTLPKDTKQVSAFYNNFTLLQVIANADLESIGEMCFANCSGLQKADFSVGLKTIGEKSFAWCSCLKEIKLPSTVENILDEAFTDCIALKTMTIPKNVKYIGDKIFQRCENLTDVYFENPSIKIEYKLFGYENKNFTIHSKSTGGIEEYCKKYGYKFKPIE